VATLAERINQVWPDTAKNTMIELSATKKNITISGSISNHTYYRYDRNHLYFFVNKRWIRNQNLSKALLKGYLNVIPPARFPAAVIEVTVDPHEVDINIHPRKQEVQFLHPRMVEQLLTDAVKKALEEHLSAKIKKPVFMQPSVDISSFEQSPFTQNFRTASFDTQPNLVTIPKPQMLKDKEPEPLSEKINNQKILPDQTSGQTMAHEEQHLYKLLGQYHKTYILTESQEGLFIIDQHAAHERILYEQFKERFGSIATIKLLFPQIITLSQADYQRIIEHCSLFEHHGIGIESFGLNQIIIQSTPVHLKNCSLEELIKEISSLIHEYQGLEHEEFSKKVHEKVHAQMACKAAVKAGDELTTEKMEQLLKDLAQTKNRFACPHGRPTGWLLSLDELERTFKRKL
ncbi:MAG: DNA mismatch repair endonuclease MutL, partial [Candidatus Babeliales bacterium]